jgi:hypothetical protein
MSSRPAYFLAIWGIVWAITGCRPDFTQEIAAVESMVPVLDALEQRLTDLDTTAATQVAERLSFQCDRILPAMDSLEVDSFPIWLSGTCDIPVQISASLGRRRVLAQELDHTRKQLNDLMVDLRERRANKDSVSAFIEVEFQYVQHLGEALEELEGRFQQLTQIEPEVRSGMDSLMTITTAKFVE